MSTTDVNFLRRVWSQILHFYFRLTRGLTLGVRAVIVSNDSKVLLVRHTYAEGWDFPGGGVRPGESPQQSLARELREETGLNLVGTPKLLSIDYNSEISERDYVITYYCETESHTLTYPASFEIAELAFFNPDRLPDQLKSLALQWIPIAQEVD